MKKLITKYTFDASAKTIIFSEYSTILQAGILLITNTTDNIIIYNFASSTLNGTVSQNVLTLTYDTSSMSDGDSIQIYYDDPNENIATTGEKDRITSFVVDKEMHQILTEIHETLKDIQQLILER